MPGPPDPSQAYSLKDATDTQSAQLDAILSGVQKNLRRTGVDPASPTGKMHIAQALQAFGINPKTVAPFREMGIAQSPQLGQPVVPPTQTREQMVAAAERQIAQSRMPNPAAHRESAQLWAQSQPPVGASQIDESTIYQPSGATIKQEDPAVAIRRAANVYAKDVAWAKQQDAQLKNKQLQWMDNPREMERSTYSLAKAMRPEKGKGKGRWVEFDSLPQSFRDAYEQEFGKRPAGFYLGEVGKRDRILTSQLLLKSAKDKEEIRRATHQPSGGALPQNRTLEP